MDTQNKAERFWDRTASNYDKEEKKDEKIHLQVIQKSKIYLKPTDTVLDFGCGTGFFSNELSQTVKNIHAIDFSAKMIQIAQTKAQQQNIRYEQTTIFDGGIQAGSYDAVLGFYVLHLLDDPPSAVNKIRQLLKPGGLLISVTPCMGEKPMLSALLSIFSKFGMVPPMKSFKQNDLEQLLTADGFEIVEKVLLLGTSNQYFVVSKKMGDEFS